jgi:hypothetical protein
MVIDGTKVVQAERNGKKNLFFLAFPRRRLPCPRLQVEGNGSASRAKWQENFIFSCIYIFFRRNLKKKTIFAFSNNS